ncbi:hypothetical protein V490_04600 [Pseudogymnoascus sp. VKM F-3557]|nr:hypothetical protein V490_04600 [Pseudogymnoascus sp. VKM F-3557]
MAKNGSACASSVAGAWAKWNGTEESCQGQVAQDAESSERTAAIHLLLLFKLQATLFCEIDAGAVLPSNWTQHKPIRSLVLSSLERLMTTGCLGDSSLTQ